MEKERFRWDDVRWGHCLFACMSVMVIVWVGCQSDSNRTDDIHEPKAGVWSDLLPKPSFVSVRSAETPRIQGWYDSMLVRTGFAGGIIVARNDSILFERYSDKLIDGKPMGISATQATHIASVSKTFTALAVMHLAQAKQIDLDQPLQRYMPEFPFSDITIRHLLNHRSGLPNYTHYLEEMQYDTSVALTNQALLEHLVAYRDRLPNVSPTNKRFAYCNTNYALLASLIERVSGKLYPDFMQDSFFRPLGMEHSFVFRWADTSRVPISYDWRGRIYPYNFLDAVYGDKNIYSTPRDLLIWDAYLRRGAGLETSLQDQMYQPYSFERPGYRHYGLGWRLTYMPGLPRIIYHNGWWHGNNAVFFRLPDQGVVIIVLGNQFNRNIYKARMLANLFGDFGAGTEEEDSASGRAGDKLP